jgi:hypothetical protein
MIRFLGCPSDDSFLKAGVMQIPSMFYALNRCILVFRTVAAVELILFFRAAFL